MACSETVVVSLMINALLFFAAFRLLTDASVATRDLLPGIVVGAVAWTALQAVGGAYIGHVVKGAGATYGTFATVIGLLTWLFLGARVVVYSAEVSSVLRDRSWPRSLVARTVPQDDVAATPAAQPRESRQRSFDTSDTRA